MPDLDPFACGDHAFCDCIVFTFDVDAAGFGAGGAARPVQIADPAWNSDILPCDQFDLILDDPAGIIPAGDCDEAMGSRGGGADSPARMGLEAVSSAQAGS